MKSRYLKNYICLLMIVSMIFSGICFEDTTTYSLFSYATSESTSTYLDLQNGLASSQKLCTLQMLGQRNIISSPKTPRRSYDIRGIRTVLFKSLADIFLQNSSLLYASESVDIFNEFFSNTVIITYIHMQDGQKA